MRRICFFVAMLTCVGSANASNFSGANYELIKKGTNDGIRMYLVKSSLNGKNKIISFVVDVVIY